MTDADEQKHPPYEDPKTIDEANTRRTDLATKISKIQARLAAGKDGRTPTPEWKAWRARATAAMHHINADLRRVNQWLRDYNTSVDAERRQFRMSTQDVSVKRAAVTAMQALLDHISMIERELAVAQVDNTALRHRVAELTGQLNAVAPGDGVDAWRDGYTTEDEP